MLSRRLFAQSLAALWAALHGVVRAAAANANIVAVRVWPAPEYTRVTLESDAPLRYTQTPVSNPPRLAVDFPGVPLSDVLRSLSEKVPADDPNIASIRVRQYTPEIVRVAIDLKHPIRPQIFELQPVAAYRNRLVLDFYPVTSADPLEQLLAQYPLSASENAALARAAPRPPQAHEQALDALISDRSGQVVTSTPSAAPPPSGSAAAPAPGAPAVVRSKTDRLIIVALDPGHGGEDPGAVGPGGTREKDVVLAIARLLRKRIDATRANGVPMRAFMTRDADYLVPLNERVHKARRVQANLFISIHADAFITPQAHGSSVFALSQRGASSSAARWLARKENEADLVGGIDMRNRNAALAPVLLDLTTTAQIRDSKALGALLLKEISGINRLHKSQVEQAGFAVLKAPDIASVLVETAFVSNPAEEALLRSSAFQARMADALLRGIVRYFVQNPPQPRVR